MRSIEFNSRPNILISDSYSGGDGENYIGAGDLSSITDEENALLAAAILRGSVRKEGLWFHYTMPHPYGSGIVDRQTISRRVVVDMLKREE